MAGKFYQALFLGLLTITISCETFQPTEEVVEPVQIIPQETGIYIPSSLNESSDLTNQKALRGDVIYNYIRGYVKIADLATKVVENTYNRISVIENSGTLEFSYTGLDGKTKNVSIQENYNDSVSSWDYYMEIYNETFADLALKTWWNKSPHEQKILFNPSSLNVNEMTEYPEALVEINYKTGDAASPYEKSFFVALKGLTKGREISFDPDNIIINIGQIGNTLDIIGASYNPDVILLNSYYRGGRNWTFLAKVNTTENIAVAQLALPPSSVASIEGLFNDYSFKQVILDEIRLIYPGNDLLSDDELLNLAEIDRSMIENIAYFDQNGFLSAGEAPSATYSALSDFEGMEPFIPSFVKDYEIKLRE